MSLTEVQAREFCASRLDVLALERLSRLAALLSEENQRQNLVSGRSLSEIWQRHFADSVQLLDFAAEAGAPWIDLGTGAGFPGLVLAIARPEKPVLLVESRKRRVDWLERCLAELELPACRTVGTRVEDLPTQPAALITARAFAPLGKLLDLSARFSTPDTVWLLPKGRSAAQELTLQPREIQAMFHVEQSKTDAGGGILVGRGAVRVV